MQNLRLRNFLPIALVLVSACGDDDKKAAADPLVAITCNRPEYICLQETVPTSVAVTERADCTNSVSGTNSDGLNCEALASTHDGSPAGYVSHYCVYGPGRAYYAASQFSDAEARAACADIPTSAGGPGTWVP